MARYPDDSSNDGPDREPLEEVTYNGPRYPDDSDGPNRTVYKQGHWILCDNGSWAHDGDYDLGKGGPD